MAKPINMSIWNISWIIVSLYIVLILLLTIIVGASRINSNYEDDLIVEGLPGQPSHVSFKQYAGYVVVDAKAGRALFYYFVEAASEPHLKPLTLWLNGGPGCSSVGNGAFEELGPFRPNGYGRGLITNKHSWNKVTNLLFLESPAGVGFSYSNTSSDLTTNDNKTTKDSLRFLLGWFKKFPHYKSREFFLTGESYAGHYIPQLASLLVEYNERHNDHIFNLQGVAIGNPFLNPSINAYTTYLYWWSHGIISDETFHGIKMSCDFDDYESNDKEPMKCQSYITSSLNESSPFINQYDVNVDVCYSSIAQQELRLNKLVHNSSLGVDICLDSEIEFYLNLPEVQRTLHANTTYLGYTWSLCRDPNVLKYSEQDDNVDMKPYLENILRHNIRVWLYSGDMDSVVPFLGTRTIVTQIAQSMKLVKAKQYGPWYINGQVGGWTVTYGDLTFATVRGAGHMVPMYQPARALHLIEKFLFGKTL